MTPPGPIVAALLSWYAGAARDLPWRRAPSPYHVLLSELMLQQTRVETVIPYFERFVARWPSLEALAAAPEEDVLHAWAGLGYYSRARNLLAAAHAASAAGGLPSEPEALRALPGVGPYTAGAIASIAFGARAALVDGNVERVLCRLDRREEDPRREGRAAVWARAEALVAAVPEGEHPGALNQALMELGATVCVPKRPRCSACPVAAFCLAREHDPERLPNKAAKAPPVPVWAAAVVARADGGTVLGRRPKGLLGGLWEPVCTPLSSEAQGPDALRAAFTEATGAELVGLSPLGEVMHVFTHRRLTCAVWEARVWGEPSPTGRLYDDVRVVAEPESLALSALARRILAAWSRPALPLAAEPDPPR